MLFSRQKIAKIDRRNRDSSRTSIANLRRAARSAVEPLETRVMLSVTCTLFDQYLHTGVTWVYDVTSSAGSGTQTNTVLGPATAPDGATATEEVQTVLEGTFSTSNGDVTGTEETDDYYGLGANGLIDYYVNHVETGDDDTGQSNTFNDTFSPYKTVFPASLSAGATVDETDTDTLVDVDDQDSTPSVSNETHEITLVSETPTSITVPAGTFSCYEVTYTHTAENSDDTDTSVNTETDYFSPGIGVVEVSSTADDLTGEWLPFKGKPHRCAGVYRSRPTRA